MARIKIAYLGGGSTRAAGTMASFLHTGEDFDGSEVVLIDLDADRLDLIRRLAERMAKAPRARHHDHRHDRPARRPDRRRRGALELPSRRLRGARARRAHPALAGRDRPGDAGAGRVLHGAALHQRAAAGRGRAGRGRAAREGLQLHQPGQHRGAGVDAQQRHPAGVALRGPDHLPARAGARPRPRRGPGRGAHGRPQPRLLVLRRHVRRARLHRGDRRAVAGPRAAAIGRAARAARRHHGSRPGRVLQVLLLRG